MTEVFAIRVFMDGDKWCALVGAECCGGNLPPANLLLNLQHGVSGWGDTKEAAIADYAQGYARAEGQDKVTGVVGCRCQL